ncbi:MAG: hypothetical protein E6Q97_15845 [Desulfurellales bacterium]|nr:MAG: hypothetical protein E6Q97_15845 [Desulfurellales bacterium]
MATITQLTQTTWTGTFNTQPFRITKTASNTEAVYLAGELRKAVVGDELRSLLRFYAWHIASGRNESELPVLYAASNTVKEAA